MPNTCQYSYWLFGLLRVWEFASPTRTRIDTRSGTLRDRGMASLSQHADCAPKTRSKRKWPVLVLKSSQYAYWKQPFRVLVWGLNWLQHISSRCVPLHNLYVFNTYSAPRCCLRGRGKDENVRVDPGPTRPLHDGGDLEAGAKRERLPPEAGGSGLSAQAAQALGLGR